MRGAHSRTIGRVPSCRDLIRVAMPRSFTWVYRFAVTVNSTTVCGLATPAPRAQVGDGYHRCLV